MVAAVSRGDYSQLNAPLAPHLNNAPSIMSLSSSNPVSSVPDIYALQDEIPIGFVPEFRQPGSVRYSEWLIHFRCNWPERFWALTTAGDSLSLSVLKLSRPCLLVSGADAFS